MKENDSVSCIKCLYTSNHAFGIAFNEYGLCTGCQIHEEKNYYKELKQFEEIFSEIYFVQSEHLNRFSPLYNNDKLLIMIK